MLMVALFSAWFRAGSKVLIRTSCHQARTPHGFVKSNILMGALEGTGMANRDQTIGTEVRMLEIFVL